MPLANAVHPPEIDAESVCAVVVTYGDRSALLLQVIDALLQQAVSRIVVVDNGSVPASTRQLDALAARQPALTVVRWPVNRGSAPGYAKGIETALQSACPFIWMLDDDNQPQAGALDCLRRFWRERCGAGIAPDRLALSSFRQDRPNFVQALVRNDPSLIYPPRNAFAGFHVLGLWNKLRERLLPPPAPATALPASGRLEACAFGGLFAHRDLMNRFGLPNADYVLYFDDFAYTHRISNGGGEIWLLRDSRIVDLESSEYLPAKKKLLYHSVFDSKRDAAVYYGFRNAIHFCHRHRVDSPLMYLVNKLLFLTLMLLMGLLRGQGHRLRVLWQAVQDGEAGRLGPRATYPL